MWDLAYRWHGSLALEASSDSVVDAFWFAPVGCDTHVPIGLVAIEAVCPCDEHTCQFRVRYRVFLSNVKMELRPLWLAAVSQGFEVVENVRFLTIGTCFFAETI